MGNFRGTKFSRMGPFREYIFEDGPLVTIENNGKSAFRVVKISRMQANPRKHAAKLFYLENFPIYGSRPGSNAIAT